MEAPELQVMGSHSSSSTGECPCPTASTAAAVFKRKRTKRLRAEFPSPPPPPPTASSTSSIDLSSTTTTEEEATAHCLILLAQGRALDSPPPPTTSTPPPEKFTSRKFTETITTAGGKAGFYVYECRTCNRCFPSFQALGGHRASHKKPRLAGPADEKSPIPLDVDDATLDISLVALPKPPTGSGISMGAGRKLRVHECSICGSEFSSGQALGGHMRRHRPIGGVTTAAAEVSQHQIMIKDTKSSSSSSNNNMLSLDLNLPAPSEDLNSNPPSIMPPAFSLPENRPLAFSATSALVDCHY